MNFEFAEEQQMLRTAVRNFVDKVIMPYVADVDQEGTFDTAIMTRLADLGLTGV